MVDSEIPDDVLHFIELHIQTVPHMEALLMLQESCPRQWTAAEMASRIYIDSKKAARILNDLTRSQIIAQCTSGVYVYLPDNPHGELMTKVTQTYRRQLIEVARFIHSRGSPALQDFSRAFKFKGND